KERQENRSRGPRSLLLRRCDNNGFGFTLRHFIVYPPESYTVLQGPGSAALDQSMDTIFVKNVRENSSAHVAGLATGDRIIGSGNLLHLLVVPKEDDILQLYFGETAHNPETNQRPSRVKSPEVTQHHRNSMMRQQSPVPFPSQQSSLPMSHHMQHHHHHHHNHHRQQNSTYLSDLPAANTATCRTSLPSTVNSSNIWSPPSTEHMTMYHGAASQDPSGEFSNYRSHSKSPSIRRNSEGNNPSMNRESGYSRGGAGSGNESNTYYGVPGSDRRVSSDNSVWTRASSPGHASDNNIVSSSFGSSENINSSGGSANGLQRLHYSGMAGSKDSLISYDSSSTLTGGQDRCSSDDSLIMSRIRKSFEQKEEFLKRPNQPISWNISSGNQQQATPLSSQHAIIAREFYARPQKFQRPVWPPQNPPSSPILYRQQSPPRSSSSSKSNYSSSSSVTNKPTHQNLQRVKSDIDSERDSLSSRSSGFSQHSQFRPITPISSTSSNTSSSSSHRHAGAGKPSFVSTLTRIHENIPVSDPGANVEPTSANSQYSHSLSSASEQGANTKHPAHPHPMLQIVSKRAHQFETGKLDEEEGPPSDRTSFYRSELSRLSSKRSVPNVAVRKREFESRSSSASGGGKDGRRMNRESRSLESAGSGLSGNRLIPVGGKHLHCEPPHEFTQHVTDPPSECNDDANEPVKLRARSNSAESWAAIYGDDGSGDGANEPQRHKAMRQDSYLAAVRTPVTAER
ncbi:hypothetical protein L9F63_011289, partial [Diploptera punctata]